LEVHLSSQFWEIAVNDKNTKQRENQLAFPLFWIEMNEIVCLDRSIILHYLFGEKSGNWFFSH
jgi:hypothetical protein